LRLISRLVLPCNHARRKARGYFLVQFGHFLNSGLGIRVETLEYLTNIAAHRVARREHWELYPSLDPGSPKHLAIFVTINTTINRLLASAHQKEFFLPDDVYTSSTNQIASTRRYHLSIVVAI
jgi:hypothetical protein